MIESRGHTVPAGDSSRGGAPRRRKKRSCQKWMCVLLPAISLGMFGLIMTLSNRIDDQGPRADQFRPSVRGGRGRGFLGEAVLLGPGADHTAPVVAFAVSVTSLAPPKSASLLDAAEVLVTSIRRACTFSAYRCETVALVLPSVGMEERRLLEEMGWKILKRDLPVAVEEIENESYRDHVVKSGCCGADEFLKLHAYTLTNYHRVVHLDVDTVLLHPMDELMESEASLLYTTDPAMAMQGQEVMPIQGGFLVVRPDLEVYEKLRAVVRKGDWKKGVGWGGSKIGWFYGGATIQGLLPYFYHELAPGTALEIDRCAYNHMSDSDKCRSGRYAPTATFLHRHEEEADDDEALLPAVIAIRSVHFTQACTKPWFCARTGAHEPEGPCPLLQHAWLEIRREVFANHGFPFTEACHNGVYSPVPRSWQKDEERIN